MVITNRLVRIRKARGFSQERLADLVNETKAQVSRIERHRRHLKIDKMVDYAVALACHPAELFDEPWTIHRQDISLIETFHSLDAAKQRVLLQFIRGLALDEDPEELDDDVAVSG